jgi:nitrate reductase gamma subunit
MIVVNLLVWVGGVLFLVGALAKIVRFARMPMHVRWELYPVPHEKGKSSYGGSFLEEIDWWTKKIPKSKASELKAMGEEILLLKGVFESNRPLWIWTFPFHLGLYLIVVFVGLLILGGIVEAIGATPLSESSSIWRFVHHLSALVAWAGLILGGLGTLGILQRRLNDKRLKGFTPPLALLNLVFMLVIFCVGILARALVDADATLLRGVVSGFLRFSPPVQPVPILVVTEVTLFAIFAAYMPFTFMSHMYMKFFTYHSVRWDDHPRRPGDPTDPRLMEYLKYPVSWSAKHIKKGKHETWADVVLDQEAD